MTLLVMILKGLINVQIVTVAYAYAGCLVCDLLWTCLVRDLLCV